ncbi:MAG: LysM peptidoglycan-binding domain-containing protein [Desulfobacteraceae bacterium]|nr:MAG: LysM peptidoglycan-binding domain-containing protein [Desulfobacteraceae bacterium]
MNQWPRIGCLFLGFFLFTLFLFPEAYLSAASVPARAGSFSWSAEPIETVTPAPLLAVPDRDTALEEALKEKPVNEIPPVIRPSQEEIRKKVILEWKELQKGLAPEYEVSNDIPLVINDQVEYFLDYFQTKMPKRFSLWLSRSGRYIPMIKKVLNEQGLPEDLIYLAMIESGFSNKAYSRAQAAGMWQFIRETGQRYGLKINSWVDERKDPVKSTQAAARHLSDLFKRFGSWYLAAAGYNAGEGKITRALAMYDAQTYWDITAEHCNYIKDETKQYVPKMIAAALIAKEPEKYGFNNIAYQPPLSYEEVTLPGAVELKDVASASGVEVHQLVDLNPELKRWITPPGESEYRLRVPPGAKERLLENYAQLIKPKPRVVYAHHKVKKGERFTAIARKYGVNAATIAKVNRVKLTAYPAAGSLLLIPQKGFPEESPDGDLDGNNGNAQGSKARPSLNSKTAKRPERLGNKDQTAGRQPLRYRVKRGDTLVSIAQNFEITVGQIRKWNPKESKKVQAGKTLNLYVSHVSGEEKSRPETEKKIKGSQRKSLVRADLTIKPPSVKKQARKRIRTVAKGPKEMD